MPNFMGNIVKVTQAQYITLIGGGSITKGGVTYTYDPNAIYLTPTNSITDVSINGTSIVSYNKANIKTKGEYDATNNKLATENEISGCVYCYCSTAGNTANKTVSSSNVYPSINNFKLTVGSRIYVYFQSTNNYAYSGDVVTLNINNTGTYDIRKRYSWIDNNQIVFECVYYKEIYTGDVLSLVFDGSYWIVEDVYHNAGDTVIKQDGGYSAGYRIWSKGWVEQWGTLSSDDVADYNDTATNVTFIHPFANANYLAFATPLAGSNYIDGAWVTGQTTTQMIVHTGYQSSSAKKLKCNWYAMGFKA